MQTAEHKVLLLNLKIQHSDYSTMKTVFRFFGLAAIITAAALCVSCARHAVRPSAEYSAWIKAYTGNIISRNSTVKIVLAAPVDNSVFPSSSA